MSSPILPRWNPQIVFMVCLASQTLAMPARAMVIDIALGEGGIRSTDLGLTGEGVAIGQVELFRPGQPGFDSDELTHPLIQPASVALRDLPPRKSLHTGVTAEHVAGILISQDENLRGIVPDADLFASAYVTPGTDPGFQHALLATQDIARRNDGDLPVINHSWGKPLEPGARLDGNSLLSLGMDWMAQEYEVLHVFAGNFGSGGSPLPTDSYNGLVVGAAELTGGVFSRIHAENRFQEDAIGPRTTISLVAPGSGLNVLGRGETTDTVTGTIYAAPLVTGTAALLQEYAEKQIRAESPGWSASARRPEVLKAVLLNSTDKVADTGDGRLLGMDKTISTQEGTTWLDSPAAQSKTVPLDPRLGAGQLNAERALQQYSSGESEANGSQAVPTIGWDWQASFDSESRARYVISEALPENAYISITLTWNRDVSLVDHDNDGRYDEDESFTAAALADLNLYLLPEGARRIEEHVWASTSLEHNVEHIFFPVPEEGRYEFWVELADGTLADQGYAVAWWTGASSNSSLIPGDADGDGDVDLADFRPFKENFGIGTERSQGDFDGDGDVDLADFQLFKENFGRTSADLVAAAPVATSIAVAEPNSWLLALVAGLALLIPWRCRNPGILALGRVKFDSPIKAGSVTC